MGNIYTLRTLLLFLVCAVWTSVTAQTSILYTSIEGDPLPLDPINICQDELFYNAARVVVVGNAVNNTRVTITFPDGVEYVPGSLEMINSSEGISISEGNVSGPSSYEFEVSPVHLAIE